MAEEGLYIIWPEKKFISPEQIKTWFEDAKANGELDEYYLEATTWGGMAAGLQDAGLITVSNARRD